MSEDWTQHLTDKSIEGTTSLKLKYSTIYSIFLQSNVSEIKGHVWSLFGFHHYVNCECLPVFT